MCGLSSHFKQNWINCFWYGRRKLPIVLFDAADKIKPNENDYYPTVFIQIIFNCCRSLQVLGKLAIRLQFFFKWTPNVLHNDWLNILFENKIIFNMIKKPKSLYELNRFNCKKYSKGSQLEVGVVFFSFFLNSSEEKTRKKTIPTYNGLPLQIFFANKQM